jgi:hypothetical protein
MDERMRRLAEQLLDTGFDKLSERERRVITRVAERSQISLDVNSVFDEMSWLGKFGQADEWSFCLRAARMAREQERR